MPEPHLGGGIPRNSYHGVRMSEEVNLYNEAEGLVVRYLSNPRAELKDLIMVQYAPTVERVARRFAGLESFEDLVQVGYIGLLNALSKFDPDAGVRFNTYATYLVAGEIKHYLRDRAQVIRHPAWLQELRHKVNKVTGSLQSDLQRPPTEREIADALGVSESAIREVVSTGETLRVASLDSTPQSDDDEAEIERLDSAAFCPEQLSVEDRVVLEHALQQLRDLERQVLVAFHFESMNQTEIANRLGISCNYVSHILRQSLAKLRKILSAEEEKDRMLRRQAAQIDYDVIDAVTGAYTEGYFRSRLQEEIHRTADGDNAVAIVQIRFVGLDKMKAFYGENSVIDFMGDAADHFKSIVRRLDVVARVGADSFGILLPSSGQNIGLIQSRILHKATEWMGGKFGQNAGVTIELGHAQAPRDGKLVSELLAKSSPKALKSDKAA